MVRLTAAISRQQWAANGTRHAAVAGAGGGAASSASRCRSKGGGLTHLMRSPAVPGAKPLWSTPEQWAAVTCRRGRAGARSNVQPTGWGNVFPPNTPSLALSGTNGQLDFHEWPRNNARHDSMHGPGARGKDGCSGASKACRGSGGLAVVCARGGVRAAQGGLRMLVRRDCARSRGESSARCTPSTVLMCRYTCCCAVEE